MFFLHILPHSPNTSLNIQYWILDAYRCFTYSFKIASEKKIATRKHETTNNKRKEIIITTH